MGLKKKNIKRELIEWGIIIAIPLGLYLSGTHTAVIGNIQGIILMTGIFTPDYDIPLTDQKDASYDFRLINQAGEKLDFAEFKGKTVFVNFWATWCAPCIAEMPDIQKLYEQTGDQVEFVMISVDNEADRTWNFANTKGFTFPVYRRNSLIPEIYERQVIPTTFVISPEGKIVAERHGMAKYNTEEFRSFLLQL